MVVLLHADGNTRNARQVLAEATGRVDTTTALYLARIYLLYVDRQYDRLLQVLSRERQDPAGFYLWHAFAHRFAGRRDRSIAYADSARAEYQRLLAAGAGALPLTRQSAWESFIGLMYGLMEQRDDALLWGRRALETLPPSKDANVGPIRLEQLAQISVLVGDPDQALDYLEQFAQGQRRVESFFPLQLNPVWDPVRNDPRFQRLVRRMK